MKKKEPKDVMGVIIPTEQHKRLKEMGEEDYRSVRGMLKYLIDKEWKERENEGNIIKNQKYEK